MTYIYLPHEALLLNPTSAISSTHMRDIRRIEQHILTTGLLNPLIVRPHEGRYMVVDGAKRLQAIYKLSSIKALPRALHKIPCLIVDECVKSVPLPEKPFMLSDADLAHGIITAARDGLTNRDICDMFLCSENIVVQALRVQSLHPKLQSAFSRGTITLAQAAAFASFPNPRSQWQLLQALGPFASDTDIINAISSGRTVLELTSGDVVILPSRERKPYGRPNTPPRRHTLMAA